MQKSHTITNEIKVLRSGSPRLPAVLFGCMFAVAPLMIMQENVPYLVFGWVLAMWIIQGIFGQFNVSGNNYDLKRTDSRKTALSYSVLVPLALALVALIIFTPEAARTFAWLIGAVFGIAFMLCTRYLSPWAYKEPRSNHFQHDQHESSEQVTSR